MAYTEPLARLIEELQKFPGVGPKSAQRQAFNLIKRSQPEVQSLANAILEAKQKIHLCPECFQLTAENVCEVCASPKRQRNVIAVVAEVPDLIAIEQTMSFSGLYHVLGGLISPLDGIGPNQLTLAALVERVQKYQSEITEVFLALPPSVEGDTTSMYITQQLKPLNIQLSRIAFGIPVGGELEYADSLTLGRAIQGRTTII